MSAPHPTIAAWTRDDHDGFYTAKLHDWNLRVRWTPNSANKRGSFHWEADRGADQKPVHSHEGYEEMSHAMAEAEIFARQDARARTAAIAATTGG